MHYSTSNIIISLLIKEKEKMRKFIVIKDEVELREFHDLKEATKYLNELVTEEAEEVNEVSDEQLDMFIFRLTSKYQIQIEKEW